MKRHLTSQQVSEWVSGERTAEQERHVVACSGCQSEIARMEGALSLFRTLVHESAAAELENAPPLRYRHPETDRRAGGIGMLSWGLAVAAVCAVMTLSTVLWQNHRAEQDTAVTDAKLLLQIDAALSRAVPQPMEPLAKLVAWDGSSSAVAR